MSTIAVCCLYVIAAVSAPDTLTGRVLNEDGSPLAGAVVSLDTAKPRTGIAVTCPSCYRDCAKSATTDAAGEFSVTDLDTNLLFHVLIAAPGRKAELTKWTDPAKAPLEIKLSPLPTDLPADRILKGRVLDEKGKPLAGAVVSPSGAKTSDKRWWGQVPNVDQAAVTDSDGKFAIASQDPKLGLDVQVKARGYAVFPSHLFDLDGSEHEIRMYRGASISGRLLLDKDPVKRRAVGVVQQDRSTEQFVGETTMASDGEGNFLFANLQPHQEYALYTICSDARDLPVFKSVVLTTPDDGEVKSLDNVQLTKGLKLAGQVEFPAGSTIPKGAKVRLIRDPAWDWCEETLSENGEFTFHNLPPEVYVVSVIAPGFQIDASRMRYQLTDPSAFGIRLRGEADTPQPIHVAMKPKTPAK